MPRTSPARLNMRSVACSRNSVPTASRRSAAILRQASSTVRTLASAIFGPPAAAMPVDPKALPGRKGFVFAYSWRTWSASKLALMNAMPAPARSTRATLPENRRGVSPLGMGTEQRISITSSPARGQPGLSRSRRGKDKYTPPGQKSRIRYRSRPALANRRPPADRSRCARKLVFPSLAGNPECSFEEMRASDPTPDFAPAGGSRRCRLRRRCASGCRWQRTLEPPEKLSLQSSPANLRDSFAGIRRPKIARHSPGRYRNWPNPRSTGHSPLFNAKERVSCRNRSRASCNRPSQVRRRSLRRSAAEHVAEAHSIYFFSAGSNVLEQSNPPVPETHRQ